MSVLPGSLKRVQAVIMSVLPGSLKRVQAVIMSVLPGSLKRVQDSDHVRVTWISKESSGQ